MVRSPMVRIRVVGAAEVRVGRALIKPDATVLFALALYLGLSAGTWITRADLLDIFWPDVAHRSRRHAFRQLLYRLRQRGLVLILNGDELLLERSHVESDLDNLFAADWPDVAEPVAIAAAATILPGYAGPMPERFRAWLDSVRARFGARYRLAVARQVARARREGRWADVDAWAKRGLQADPLNQDATLARAEAARMMNATPAAIRILDDYLHELGDEAGAVGAPAMLLRQRIVARDSARRDGSLPNVPLVGRAAELARLNALLDATLQGRGAAVMIVGALGVGKSALVGGLLESANMHAWTSVTCRLSASHAHRALAPVGELFSSVLAMPGALGCSPDALRRLRALSRHGMNGHAGQSRTARATQARLTAAAIDVLGGVCDENPLVIVLEDLHWCDAASARLLQQVIERTSALPLCWVLTARPERRFPIVSDVLLEETVARLRVAPLRHEDSALLFGAFTALSSPGRGGALRATAHLLTGGNPLFIREIARHCVEHNSASSLPHSLRSLVRDRASRLSPLARHALHACAVLGSYATIPRIVNLLEVRTADFLACLEELQTLGVVGAGRRSNALALHELWRQQFLSSMDRASRHALHHRCAVVLTAEAVKSRSAPLVWEAARHFVASGADAEAARLLREAAECCVGALGAQAVSAKRRAVLNAAG